MTRRAVKLVLGAALAASAATGGAAWRRLAPPDTAGARAVVPPLADPALVPGVARCTSDGVCTVTDALGTRAATRLAVTR